MNRTVPAAVSHPGAVRILHVIDCLQFGGSPTFLNRLSAGLARRGHVQEAICLNVADPAFVARMDPAVGLTRHGKWQYLAGVSLVRLLHHIRRFKPDVVHTILPYSDFMGRLDACTVNASCLIPFTARWEGVRREVISLVYNGIDPSPYLDCDRAASRHALGLADAGPRVRLRGSSERREEPRRPVARLPTGAGDAARGTVAARRGRRRGRRGGPGVTVHPYRAKAGAA